MAAVGLANIDPWARVGDLGVGHQQMVEIARNLVGDCRLLVLDEPTAMLMDREVELLFLQIVRLKSEGVAIVYISLRLEELKRIANRIVVLRDGKLVCDADIQGYSSDDLVRLMVAQRRCRVLGMVTVDLARHCCVFVIWGGVAWYIRPRSTYAPGKF